MRQMLSSIQETPLIGMAVLLIFSSMFGYILFEALRRKNKEAFEEAAFIPLEDEDRSFHDRR